MINVAIIGYGKMGRIRAKAIAESGDGRVVSVYDPGLSATHEGSDRALSIESIMTDPRIDAIFICTPNYLNHSLTLRGLRAEKHVFCEKPPALSASHVQQIQEAERCSGKKLMYGFNHRHHRSIQYMKGVVESGEHGRVLWMRGRYGKSVGDDFFHGWRAKRELAGGGILIDQGIHMLDLFLYLAGGFDEVYALVSRLYWKLDVEDNVFAILRNNETGVAASLHSTMTQWRHLFSLEVFLERGYMVLNGLKTSSGTYGDEVLSIARNRTTAPAASWEDEERITYHTDASWRAEIDHFFAAIERDQPVKIGNSQDAMTLMTIVDRIYQSDSRNSDIGV